MDPRRTLAWFLGGALVASMALGAPASSAAAQDYSTTRTEARAAATEALRQTGATSISMALVVGDRTAWTTSVGEVDASGTEPDSSTRYGIGSVSKMLTAVAVMQLVDAGLVSLDAPVADYVPDFRMLSPEYRQITVRMLLDHSAGLPGADYSNVMTALPYPGYAQQVLDTLAHSRLKSTPGAMSVYCNDCFTLAGILVERVTGESFPDYVASRILAPLGMDDSRYYDRAPAPAPLAPVITPDGTLAPELTNIYAAGGLYSTPRDMARLAALLVNRGTVDGVRILSPSAVAEMGRSQVPTTLVGTVPPSLPFGLGWDSVAEQGLAEAGVKGWVKGGDTYQYHAALTVAPGEDVAAVVMAAGLTIGAADLEAIAQRIVLTALVERGTVDALPEPAPDRGPAKAAPTARQLADIAGIYLAVGNAFRISARPDGSLRLAVLDDGDWAEDPQAFTMRRDGRFWSSATPASALSLVRGWGRTYLVLNLPGGMGHYRTNAVLGQKATSATGPSPAWQQRLDGTWLKVDERADSPLWEALPQLALTGIPGLPGYLWVADSLTSSPVDARSSDTLASMSLTVPLMQGRDLNDLEVLVRPDGEWMRFGGALYRPLSTVPTLTAGSATVTIGPDGHAQWVLLPEATTLVVTGDGQWKAYDPDGTPLGAGAADGSPVAATGGTRLALFGTPGAVLRVEAIRLG